MQAPPRSESRLQDRHMLHRGRESIHRPLPPPGSQHSRRWSWKHDRGDCGLWGEEGLIRSLSLSVLSTVAMREVIKSTCLKANKIQAIFCIWRADELAFLRRFGWGRHVTRPNLFFFLPSTLPVQNQTCSIFDVCETGRPNGSQPWFVGRMHARVWENYFSICMALQPLPYVLRLGLLVAWVTYCHNQGWL